MRAFILAIAIVIGLVTESPAEERPSDVIQRQVEAFLDRDPARAFGFASPTIRNIFRTPENFALMVQRGYPMVWSPADVTYGTREQVGSRVYQHVIIADQSGAIHELRYEMIPNGTSWLINGVEILRGPQVGA